MQFSIISNEDFMRFLGVGQRVSPLRGSDVEIGVGLADPLAVIVAQ